MSIRKFLCRDDKGDGGKHLNWRKASHRPTKHLIIYSDVRCSVQQMDDGKQCPPPSQIGDAARARKMDGPRLSPVE